MISFAFINTQPNGMQGEHWILIANFSPKCFIRYSRGRGIYKFLKQHYKQMIRDALQSYLSVCGFYTTYAAFHLFKIRHLEITGVHDFIVLSFISNYVF